VKIYFKGTILENIFLNLKIGKNVLIYLEKTLLRNTTVSKDYLEGRILQEKKGNFSDAKDIYVILKNNFNTIGRYDYAGWAFLKEKEMERKSYSYEAIKRRYLMEYGLTEDSF